MHSTNKAAEMKNKFKQVGNRASNIPNEVRSQYNYFYKDSFHCTIVVAFLFTISWVQNIL